MIHRVQAWYRVQEYRHEYGTHSTELIEVTSQTHRQPSNLSYAIHAIIENEPFTKFHLLASHARPKRAWSATTTALVPQAECMRRKAGKLADMIG